MGDSTVLIVEDDLTLASVLSRTLAEGGFVTARATDGQQALSAFYAMRPDVVLLDLGLPLLDGQVVIERLRDLSATTPIVVLSARSELAERLRALSAGADDFVAKPFANDELIARIRARLRTAREGERLPGWRHTQPDAPTMRAIAEPDSPLATDLTRLEQGVFDMLWEHQGVLVPTEELLARVWGETSGEDRIRYVIKRLRRKLAAEVPQRLEIRAVHGRGYRLVVASPKSGKAALPLSRGGSA